MFQVYDAPKHWCTLFTRVAYVTSAHPQLVLISYSGDASVAASFPHGNARQSNREYVRTQPHVLADIRSKAGSARNVYQTLVLNGPADVQQQTTATPRNIEQVRNVQKSQRNLSRLTHDALYNLHEFAADSDFVHRIVTHPDLSVIMYSPDIVSLFQTLLASDSHSAVHVLSYDTTFCLGDFYLSPLLFRNADFDPAPTIPLAYLLHERKTTDTHTDFFRHLRTVVPELLTCPKLIIVTDREQAITQSLKDTVPELKHFLCWNHVLQDCKRWLQQHGAATQTEVSYYSYVRGTLEPRLVQLFPKISCTCPAAGGCYHIAAARQAIGMKDGVQRKILNLTQLRRNKRKRPDKTAGRKRPRTADVDVVAAPDADPTIAEAAVVAADDDVEPMGEQAVTIRQDICHACDSAEPPPRKNRRQHEIHWIKCDDCPRWFHIICVGVRNTTAAYTCDLCA